MAANMKPRTSNDESLDDRVARLLVGAVDLHCHSGPSVMPRDLNHIEAMHEVAAAGFRAASRTGVIHVTAPPDIS